MNAEQSEIIKDKAHLFLVWEREQKRFEQLFQSLSWSTFGHYDEHSTEVEDQLAGKTSLSPEKEWPNSMS